MCSALNKLKLKANQKANPLFTPPALRASPSGRGTWLVAMQRGMRRGAEGVACYAPTGQSWTRGWSRRNCAGIPLPLSRHPDNPPVAREGMISGMQKLTERTTPSATQPPL